jgi:capsular polysaccharide biosynthesis protein
MARFSEGTVFDRAGLAKSAGYFNQPHAAAPWLGRAADHVSLDEAALDAAPILDGTVAVFFNGNLQNYYHWLIEGVVPLDILTQAVPADRPLTLILPKSMDIDARLDHRATLQALGFDGIRTIEIAADLIRLKEAVWVESDLVERMPAVHLRRFRDRIAARHAGRRGRRDKRLLVARRGPTRMIGNLAAVEAYLAPHGFETVYLEGMAPLEQILLFQRAEFIVAPHGGGLANLAFCAAGTKIIEFMPTGEMRPFFWLISEKLELVHGVQFCPPASGEGFQAPLAVDLAKLDALYHMVEAHRGQEE